MKLPQIVGKRVKRVGRGYGSGKGGHTTGRGQKGQKARGKMGVLFEGLKVKKSLFKRLPLLRGKDKFKPRLKPIIIKTGDLNVFSTGGTVDLKQLAGKKLINEKDARIFGVKILSGGKKLLKKLEIGVPISKGALKEVEERGGKVVKS